MNIGVITIKKAYLIGVGLLAASILCFSVYEGLEILRLKNKIKSLESALVKSQDDCEIRVANIKAGKNESNMPDESSKSIYKEKPRFGLSISKPNKIIPDDIKEGLGLSDEQTAKASAAIRDYHKKKAKIYSGVSKGDGTFNFGSFEYLNEIERAINDVHVKIRSIFSGRQYDLMLERGYDRKLGIGYLEKNFSEKNKRQGIGLKEPDLDIPNK